MNYDGSLGIEHAKVPKNKILELTISRRGYLVIGSNDCYQVALTCESEPLSCWIAVTYPANCIVLITRTKLTIRDLGVQLNFKVNSNLPYVTLNFTYSKQWPY